MAKNSKKPDAKKADPRFASASYDPRFIVPSTKKNKIKVDDRFSKEELRKLNVTATGKKARVDRFGRKVKDDKNATFDKYFEEEDKPDEKEEKKDASESESESESATSSASESEYDSDETRVAKMSPKAERKVEAESEAESDSDAFIDRARGEGLETDSELDSDSDAESDVESEMELEDEKPEEGDPSDTFAVVNLDWDNVRAVDLMSTFASFVPKGGNIRSVTIYPSEYGKEQMQKEEMEGPPKELFRSKKRKDESDSDDDEDLDLTNKEDLEKAARKLYEEDDAEHDYDSKALRRYQLQRLRYYYAVVRCDSVATAKNIYDNCDGAEYESTANVFDLRYVPEDMDFDDSEAKETCTKIPSSYRPDSSFVTDALQHSKVKLTWDETPKERLALSTRLFSQKEIDDMDFKAYLASDTEGESDAEELLLKDKYKSLLGGKFSFDNGKEEEDDVDMEITFNPGLDESKPAVEAEEKEETTLEAYKRKEKERRQKRMEKYKTKQEEEPKAEPKKGKKGKKAKSTPEDEKRKAELELLMLDEEEKDKADHFSMRDIVKAEKSKNRKKKGKKNYDEELVQDKFLADLTDDRFKEVFENHEFAIDPTSSVFKKTNTMKQILQERTKRLRGGDERKTKKPKKDSSALTSLVDKLKKK